MNEVFIVVGTGLNVTLNPRSNSGGAIHVYRIAINNNNNTTLELVHKV
jgi:hypothetical protein